MAGRVAREGLSKLVTADKKTSFAQMSGRSVQQVQRPGGRNKDPLGEY